MDELRARLLKLERELFGSENPVVKTDMELVINILEAIRDKMELFENHSHTIR